MAIQVKHGSNPAPASPRPLPPPNPPKPVYYRPPIIVYVN